VAPVMRTSLIRGANPASRIRSPEWTGPTTTRLGYRGLLYPCSTFGAPAAFLPPSEEAQHGQS
jgi:hypothetical protein